MSVRLGTEVRLACQRRTAQRAPRSAGRKDVAGLIKHPFNRFSPGAKLNTVDIHWRFLQIACFELEGVGGTVIPECQRTGFDFEIAAEGWFSRLRYRFAAGGLLEQLFKRGSQQRDLVLFEPNADASARCRRQYPKGAPAGLTEGLDCGRIDPSEVQMAPIHAKLYGSRSTRLTSDMGPVCSEDRETGGIRRFGPPARGAPSTRLAR